MLEELRAKARHRLSGEAATAREAFVKERAEGLAKRSGMSVHAAQATLRKHCGGVLLPSIVLSFDDPDLEGMTVADVLADPAAFEGETLADPLEGIEYGRCKAQIMRRADGTPWIHSFAHGHTTYELKLDAAAVRAAMAAADASDVVQTFCRLALQADLGPTEEESLVGFAKERSGSGILSIKRTRNVAIEYRWANGQRGALWPLAEELAHRQVDAIFAGPPLNQAARAAKAATSTYRSSSNMGPIQKKTALSPA